MVLVRRRLLIPLIALALGALGCPPEDATEPATEEPATPGLDLTALEPEAETPRQPGPNLFFERTMALCNVHPASSATTGAKVERYPVGTRGSDVRDLLDAVQQGRRAEIPVPARFGDLAIEVYSSWMVAPDLDGDGQADRVLLRWAVVPQGSERSVTAAWLVAVTAGEDGAFGPDELKNGVLIDAVLAAGFEPPIVEVEVAENGGQAVSYVKLDPDRGQYDQWRAVPKKVSDEELLKPQLELDYALVTSAMRVYDTGVLAPETAYVKAFIVQSYMPEVDAVEATRDLMFPAVLRPTYCSLRRVAERLEDPEVASLYARRDPLIGTMTAILVHEGDLRLGLTADELTRRTTGLQELGARFLEIENSLQLDGEPVRRRDIEARLGEVADAGERAAVTKVYQDAFRPMTQEGSGYEAFIGEMNEIAREHGYRNYPDMRMVEKFGVDLEGFQAWVDQTWEATDADAKAFVDSLKQFSGDEQLTYWQVGQLTDAWALDQVGLEALPELAPEESRRIMEQMYRDVGFDMEQPPYDRVVMDWFQDDLKWNRSGTAATATPAIAYFTSNIKPGVPIPLDEWSTAVHETGHTLHYQTSGAVGQGLSSYQNNMPSYVAEGVAMTFEEVAFVDETLMRRYFEGQPGFTDKLYQVYPTVRAQSTAWQTRRLLLMASYEVGLYVDQNEDGSARSWDERVGAWDEMVRQRLFVEPPEDALAQIMCRSHPFNDQSQLGYASYPLGFSLVHQVLQKTVSQGTDEELDRFGLAMKQIMAQGALADRASVQAIVDNL